MEINYKQNKQCSRCRETLPIGDFYLSTQGVTSKCKRCTSEYNMEHRKKGGRKRKKISLSEHNHKILSLLEMKNNCSLLECKNITSYTKYKLLIGPWGWALNGELFHESYDIDYLIHILHSKNIRILDVIDSNLDASEISVHISYIRSSCREPISRLHAKFMVSSPQYFLWMDTPRPLTLQEASYYLRVEEEALSFLIGNSHTEKKGTGTSEIPPLQNFKNLGTEESQPIEFIEE